ENEKGSARRHVPGSVAFAPPAAGLIMAGEAVRQMGGV
ncbi:tRNA threonylcarbamoyladenosine dehydratase, partial [Klebsiella oxytoca]